MNSITRSEFIQNQLWLVRKLAAQRAEMIERKAPKKDIREVTETLRRAMERLRALPA